MSILRRQRLPLRQVRAREIVQLVDKIDLYAPVFVLLAEKAVDEPENLRQQKRTSASRFRRLVFKVCA